MKKQTDWITKLKLNTREGEVFKLGVQQGNIKIKRLKKRIKDLEEDIKSMTYELREVGERD